jgi:hypothetical protein
MTRKPMTPNAVVRSPRGRDVTLVARDVEAERRRICRNLAARFGGRYSKELGIDLDAGDAEVERWFLAATLFGTRIAAIVAERTFAVLSSAGIGRIGDVENWDWDDIVALLDAGGYARYDFKTATRLQMLAREVNERYGDVGAIGRQFAEPEALVSALDELPGWGATTIGLFLRELRGIWKGARLPADARAVEMGRHLALFDCGEGGELAALKALARRSSQDVRDLESALVRLDLAHRRVQRCQGGSACALLAAHSFRDAPLPGRR